MTRKSTKRTLFGFFAGAAVLGVAGAGFACTSYVGTITIAGSNGASGSATYAGNGGDDLADAYCTSPAPRVNLSGIGTFNLSVERQSCATGKAGVLAEGIYEVRWMSAKKNDGTAADPSDMTYHCNGLKPSDATKPWVPLGLMQVKANATGPDGFGTYEFPEPGPGNVCLQAVPGQAADASYSTPQIPMSWTVL